MTTDGAGSDLPRVGVVLATHNRPVLMRRALESIRAQDYDGSIEIVVVFDRAEVDGSVVFEEPDRSARVLANARTPGLAGARNTGILSLDTELVCFCDDDDVWLPGKLATQVDRFVRDAAVSFVTTAMRVDYGDNSVVRLAGARQVTVFDLARSRMSMLHSSSFAFRRSAMIADGGFGLVDETIPRSMGEDWDLLLRAARQAPIEHIDEPLVGVLWGATSYFNDAWQDKNAAVFWLLAHHPEIGADRQAMCSMQAKLAFGYASLGERRLAAGRALHALRTNWREPRTPFAVLVLLGVPAKWIVTALNKRGHGI